jgi:hypothetical protein
MSRSSQNISVAPRRRSSRQPEFLQGVRRLVGHVESLGHRQARHIANQAELQRVRQAAPDLVQYVGIAGEIEERIIDRLEVTLADELDRELLAAAPRPARRHQDVNFGNPTVTNVVHERDLAPEVVEVAIAAAAVHEDTQRLVGGLGRVGDLLAQGTGGQRHGQRQQGYEMGGCSHRISQRSLKIGKKPVAATANSEPRATAARRSLAPADSGPPLRSFLLSHTCDTTHS